ncbi:RHS repeat-associated core domain-containing protein [Actinosynnema sp. NPDC023794]
MRSSPRSWPSLLLSAILAAGPLMVVPAPLAMADEPSAFRDVDPVTGSYPESRAARAGTVPRLTGAPAVPRPSTGVAEVAVPDVGAARAGDLPIRVGRSGTAKAPAKVRVEVLEGLSAARVGAPGPLVRLSRADGVSSDAVVSTQVSYADVRNAHGGAWADRLRPVLLPECALITPEGEECAPKPLVGRNDRDIGAITMDVTLNPSHGVIVALVAGPSGSGGDFTATDLAPSATWSAGGSSGDFAWSYPMRVPPAANGPEPQLGLAYSAGSLDGRTAAANSQPSWAGDGFDLGSGSIVRSYPGCADVGHPGKGDLCWGGDNATLSLPGHGGELIQDSSGRWRLRNDDGTRIEKLTGVGNGDNDGEYWKVTTTEGMQYFFGLNRLPGWGAGRSETASAWTVPVFGDNTGEPCHNTGGFHASWCPQTYRWNLDYVVDPHGNSLSYWYTPEINHYARNATATSVSAYVRGGTLSRIDYGTRKETAGDTVFAGAPMRVSLDTADRCVTQGVTCTLSTANAANWPDIPMDQLCTSSTSCPNRYSPTFWTQKRLATVTTSVRRADTLTEVDRWTLNHVFSDPGDHNQKLLWLAGLKHEGLVGGSTTLPDITFDGTRLNNRVDLSSTTDPIVRFRLSSVRNEFGGVLSVNYSRVDCVLGGTMPAAPDRNDRRCFPVIWRHAGGATPTLDWFNKYVVTSVTETDLTGGSPATVKSYQYVGAPAWHYDEAEFVPAARKSWGQWRGYGTVSTLSGAEGRTRSRTDTVYFRGMDGDLLSNGKRLATVTDAAGVSLPDANHLQGAVREVTTYNGTDPVTRTTTDPWQHGPTARRDRNGVVVEAWATGVAATTVRVALDGGRGWRTTKTANTFDHDDGTANPTGRITAVNDMGDTATAADDTCTRTAYTTDPSRNMMTYPSDVETVSVVCTATPDRSRDLVSRVRTYYDGSTVLGAGLGQGDQTRVERLAEWNGGNPTYRAVSRAVHDVHGRVIESFDALDRRTTTSYVPTTGGPVTAEVVTNAKGWRSTTTVDPAWGLPTSVVDVNGKRTETAYDGLGRVAAVWLPGRARSQTANTTFTYQIRNGGRPTSVTTARLNHTGTGYLTSHELYDGLVRPRQTQTPAAGGGAVVTDTLHDDRGLVRRRFEPYVVATAPGDALFLPSGNVPSSTAWEYDGAERVIAVITLVNGAERRRTTTGHGGDRTDVTPPKGGTPTSTFIDARGRRTELRQYTNGTVGGAYEATIYTYTRAGLPATISSGGARWSWQYDLWGRAISTTDPDRGTVTATYDATDAQLTSTDARGVTITYDRDELGRRTAIRQGSTVLASWTHDTLARGHVTSSTRFHGGAEYTTAITAYDDAYRATGSTLTVPTGDLAGTYTVGRSYNPDGSPATTTLPEKGGLPAETVRYGYNELGLPTTVTGADEYLRSVGYDRLGRIGRITRANAGGQSVVEEWGREEGTGRIVAHAAYGDPGVLMDEEYRYDDAGNITMIADRTARYGAGPDDTQCLRHEGLGRLAEAWTPKNGDCAAAPAVAALGGPAPYWQSWTYDAAGNRRTQVERSAAGTTTQTLEYPAADQARPHAPTSVTTTGPAGTTSAAFGYDDSGNTLAKPGVTLTWNAEGYLEGSNGPDGATTYVYDADGNRLLEESPTGTTLHTDAGEYHTEPGKPVTATRSYDAAGHLIAVRTSGGLQWQMSDHQNTGRVNVDASSMAVAKRRTLPFGGDRGSTVRWPDRRGFVAGTDDGDTVHLGAREYDPALGRFLSVDPLLAPDDPRQMNGYAYAGSSPVTDSDPTGLAMCPDGDCKANPPPPKKSQARLTHLADRREVVGEQYVRTTKIVKSRTIRTHRYYNNGGMLEDRVGCDSYENGVGHPISGPSMSCSGQGTTVLGPVAQCKEGNSAGSVCYRKGDGYVYDIDGGRSCLKDGEFGPCGRTAPRPPQPRSCQPTPTPKVGPAPARPTYIGAAPQTIKSGGVCVSGSVGALWAVGGSACVVADANRFGIQTTKATGLGVVGYGWGYSGFVSDGDYAAQTGKSTSNAVSVGNWEGAVTTSTDGSVHAYSLTVPPLPWAFTPELGAAHMWNDTTDRLSWSFPW